MNTKITAQSIIGYFREEYNLLIDKKYANEIKSLCDNQNTATNEILKEVIGKDIITGTPSRFTSISIAEMKNKIKKECDKYEEIANYPIAVGKNNKFGYVDAKGKKITPLIYDNAVLFSEGLARVGINGKYGYVNTNGNEIVPCIYDMAYEFTNGLAIVKNNDEVFYIDKKGKREERELTDEEKIRLQEKVER